MTLSPQFLDELRARTLLSALIGKSVKLQKAGREFRACCPFHNEKSPSFYVNDDKAFYHCFGCGAHGDAIRFLTEHKGLPFMDAVKELAQAAGLEVPAPDRQSAERAERAAGLHDVMRAAERWFVEQLGGIAGSEARAYLQRRGIGEASQRAFGLGFAPDARGQLKTTLDHLGRDKLVETGLLIAPDGEREPYDRFRGRLMIPIRDARARTIAFGGRIIGAGEPKYLNSPETPLFDKGRTLFNLDRAGPASRKSGRILVVEGYLDVIALDQAGIGEAVAPLGTALTEAQMERLWRLVDVPILCFDGDGAGQKAAIRAALRALPMIEPGRSLAFVTLPAGQDPDDLIRNGGKQAMEALLAEPEPLVERLWKHELAAEPLTTPEARAGLRRRLTDHARTIQDRDVREQYAAEFRRRFDEAFQAPPRQAWQPRGSNPRGTPWRSPPRPASAQARTIGSGGIEQIFARAILFGLTRFPELIAAHAEALSLLPLADPALDRARMRLIESALSGAPLEQETLASILAEAGLGGATEERRQTNGLAFSFLRGNADPERARRDLGEAIDVLATRPQIDLALSEATRRFAETTDSDAFAEQQRLSAAKREAEQRLMELMQPDDAGGL